MERNGWIWELLGGLFLAEALLNLRIQWQHGLAWLNPLLFAVGFLLKGATTGSLSRVGTYGSIAIAVSFGLLCFRLLRI